MAASVEDLLIKLTKSADEQNLAWSVEVAKQDKIHADEMKKSEKDERAQKKYDKFATEQQGQEVQMSKRTQHHTDDSARTGRLLLDEQGKLVDTGTPKWDPKNTVMSTLDAAEIVSSGAKGSQIESLIHLAEGGKALNTAQLEMFEKQNDAKDDSNENETSRIKLMLKEKKMQLDHWVDQKADLGNFAGAIKTDFSLVFGSLGALTHLPGVNTILTGMRTTGALLLKFVTGWLGPKLWQGLKDLKKAFLESKAGGALTDKFKKKKQELMEKKNEFMTGGSFGGFANRMKLKTGLARKGKTTKGKPQAVVPTRFGRIMAGIMKPFMSIIKLLNPLKKVMLIAVLAVGGLVALFKGTGGKGFMTTLGEYWKEIKNLFTETILPAVKAIWDIFVADILPALGNIFSFLMKVVKFVLPPIMWIFKKIFNLIFGIFTWLYDKVFSPLARFLKIKDPAKDVKDMTDRELRVEQGRLSREEKGKFRVFSKAEKERQKRVNARLKNLTPNNTSGQQISNGAATAADNLSTGVDKILGNRNTLVADNKTNVYTGTKAFVSRTNASGMGAYGMQGRSIVAS